MRQKPGTAKPTAESMVNCYVGTLAPAKGMKFIEDDEFEPRSIGWNSSVVLSSPKDQFGKDSFPLFATDHVLKLFRIIGLPPADDGTDFSTLESQPFRWDEAAGHAPERLPLGILDEPSFSVPSNGDRIAHLGRPDGAERGVSVAKAPGI